MPKMNNEIHNLDQEMLRENIRMLMSKNGTTQKDFQELLTLTQPDISKRLGQNSTVGFTLDQTYRIAQYYNITVDQLISRDLMRDKTEDKKETLTSVEICKYLVSLSEKHIIQLNEKVIKEIVYNYCEGGDGICGYYEPSETDNNYITIHFPNFYYPKNAPEDEKDDFEAYAVAEGNLNIDNNLNINNIDINKFLYLFADALAKYEHGDYTEQVYKSLVEGLLENLESS